MQTTLTSLDSIPTDEDKETLVPGTVLAADIEPSGGERAVQPASAKFWLVDLTGKGYPLGSEPLVIGRHSGADIVVGVLSVGADLVVMTSTVTVFSSSA